MASKVVERSPRVLSQGLLLARSFTASSQRLATVAATNADTTKMSHAEIERTGAHRRPPGSNGGYNLGQAGGMDKSSIFKKEMYPIYPLFAIIGLGVGLAAWTAGRELTVSPETYLSKERRASMPELITPEAQERQAERYVESSPLRKLAYIGGPIRHLEDSAITPYVSKPLPGDDTVAVGPSPRDHPRPHGGGFGK
eukprot:jgi/Mesen1/4629/ME000237S03657